jgi:hypothetical protein
MKARNLITKVPLFFSSNLRKIQIAFLLGLLVHGCAIQYGLKPEEIETIKAGEKSIVLFNVQCDVDGKPLQVFKRRTFSEAMREDKDFIVGLGSFETLGTPHSVRVRYLSEQSQNEGWAYLLTPTGLYYFTVFGPTWWGSAITEAPRWRFEVPAKTRAVYIGTVLMKGHIDGDLMFGGKIYVPANDREIPIRDDRAIANAIFREHFKSFDEIKTVLMERWYPGEPVIIKTQGN